MKYKLSRPVSSFSANITLPASKSISNRLLIIHALGGNTEAIENLSDSDDTRLMLEALNSRDKRKDVGHAGTTMRFLTAFYSGRPSFVEMTGSARMKERPIGPLVDALRSLGADIAYLENTGYPPLEIKGKQLEGGKISIDSGISSQFISALLMLAPSMKNGMQLHLKGDKVSASYIKMTLDLMAEFGAEYKWTGDTIFVLPGAYKKGGYRVESDWSGASYWYSMALLDIQADIQLSYLQKKSLQGDSALVEIFNTLGYTSEFKGEKISIVRSNDFHSELFEFDFSNSPDIVQSLAVSLCLANIPFRFTGTKTLRIKETDRIAALQTELKKLGFLIVSNEEGSFLAWNGEKTDPEIEPEIETYNDHRMAMAFAPATLLIDGLVINDPMVVTKSYPNFWEDLKGAGFQIEILE